MWYSVCGPYDRIQRRRCEGTGEWRLRVLCDTGSALSWARDGTCTALNTTVATALCAINAQVFWYVQCFSDAIRRKHFDFRKSQGDIYSLFCEESLPVLLRGTVVRLVCTLSAVDGKMLFRCTDLHCLPMLLCSMGLPGGNSEIKHWKPNLTPIC